MSFTDIPAGSTKAFFAATESEDELSNPWDEEYPDSDEADEQCPHGVGFDEECEDCEEDEEFEGLPI